MEHQNTREPIQEEKPSSSNDRQVLETAMEAGHILLENGAEIFRVKETMDRICHSFGVEDRDFFVLSNGIFTTGGHGGENQYARVEHIPVKGTQLNKVEAVNQLSREIEEGRYSVEGVRQRLQEIRTMPGKPFVTQVLASGIGSGAFCCLFGGDLLDSAASFVAGLLLYIFVLKVSAPHLSKLVGNVCGGGLVTLICILCYQVGFGHDMNDMIVGSIIPLIPGVPFVNGIRDIADGDYISGAVRLLDAILVFLCIAIGVGVVFTLYHQITGGALL